MKQQILKLSLALITLAGAAQIHAAAGGSQPQRPTYQTLQYLTTPEFNEKITTDPANALLYFLFLITHKDNVAFMKSISTESGLKTWQAINMRGRLDAIRDSLKLNTGDLLFRYIDDNPDTELAKLYQALRGMIGSPDFIKGDLKDEQKAWALLDTTTQFLKELNPLYADEDLETAFTKLRDASFVATYVFWDLQDNPLDPKNPKQMLINVMNTFNQKMLKDRGIADKYTDHQLATAYESLKALYERLINQYYPDSRQATSDHGVVLRLLHEINSMLTQKNLTKSEKQNLWKHLYTMFLKVMKITAPSTPPTEQAAPSAAPPSATPPAPSAPAGLSMSPDLLKGLLDASIKAANTAVYDDNTPGRKTSAENIKEIVVRLGSAALTPDKKKVYTDMVAVLSQDTINEQSWETLYDKHHNITPATPSTPSISTTAGTILSESAAQNLKNKAQRNRSKVRAGLTEEQVRNLRYTADQGSGKSQQHSKDALVYVDKAPKG